MNKQKLLILGSGFAGLATGYFAKLRKLPFQILEASTLIGGQANTHQRVIQGQIFRYDTGAHRFHDKNDEATDVIKDLLKEDLLETTAPSQIYRNGQYHDFPLQPLGLVKNLGIRKFWSAGASVFNERVANRAKTFRNFKEFALYKYGEIISQQFLFDYSEKLWGRSPELLSTKIAGIRLDGLTLTRFILEGIFGISKKKQTFSKSNYYPKLGYGMIAKKLAERIGEEAIHLESRITAIRPEGKRIAFVEVNGKEEIAVNQLVSTLPITQLALLFSPVLPRRILESLSQLKFRNIRLVVIFLDIEKVSDNASIYFPEKEHPFTRISEPKNRSAEMSPSSRTSLVIEIPCQDDDDWWKWENREVIKQTVTRLAKLGLININDMIGAETQRIKNAYPILEVGYEKHLEGIMEYLNEFENLQLIGRSSDFEYAYLHHLLPKAKELIEEMKI